MKKYIGKAIVLCLLISVFFIGMYEILSYSYYKALIADGLIVKFGHQRLINHLSVGALIIFVPYEMLFSKLSHWYNDWFGKEQNKKMLWVCITMLIVNIILGVFGCFVRVRSHYSWLTPGIHFQYVMLFFVCLCMGTIIATVELENRVIKTVIRCLSIIINAFLMVFLLGVMGKAIIALVAMTVFCIVYDYMNKKLSWKETVVTGLVGVVGTAVGLCLKEYHTYAELLDTFSQNIFRFDKVDIYLGTGFFILYLLLAVGLVGVLIWAIKIMSNINKIRTAFLVGATVLYVCTFVYIFLAMFELVPCAEVQIISNRIHVTGFLLVLRCFIIIPTPKYEKKTSFVEKLLENGAEDDSDDIEFLMKEVELLIKKQNLIIEYLMTIDNRLETLELMQKQDSEEYEKLKNEIAEDRASLEKHNVPLDKYQFSARVKELYEKRNSKE